MDINVFLLFCSFVSSNWERERERERERVVYKIWYKEKQSQSYLSYFSTGFHWRIFLLSRANRLYAIFNTGLKNLGPSCPQIFFWSSSPGVLGFLILPPTNPAKQLIFLFVFFSLTGRRCHFRFRVSVNHLASPSFPLLVFGDLRLLSTNICWYPLCDLHSFLTVTFLTGCHCSFQREDSINLISIVSVGYHVTISIKTEINSHIRRWKLLGIQKILEEKNFRTKLGATLFW